MSRVSARMAGYFRTQHCYRCGMRYHKKSPRCAECRYPSQRENFRVAKHLGVDYYRPE